MSWGSRRFIEQVRDLASDLDSIVRFDNRFAAERLIAGGRIHGYYASDEDIEELRRMVRRCGARPPKPHGPTTAKD